jgi:hypothetical protein
MHHMDLEITTKELKKSKLLVLAIGNEKYKTKTST